MKKKPLDSERSNETPEAGGKSSSKWKRIQKKVKSTKPSETSQTTKPNISSIIENAIANAPTFKKKSKWRTDALKKLRKQPKKTALVLQPLSPSPKYQAGPTIFKRPWPLGQTTPPPSSSVKLPLIKKLSEGTSQNTENEDHIGVQSLKNNNQNMQAVEKEEKVFDLHTGMSWPGLKSNDTDDDGLSTYSCSDERIHGLKNKSETSLINPGVMGVLERLKEFKGTRLQSDLHHELQEIRRRVNQALKNVDFMFEDNDEKKDETKFPSIVEDIQSREKEVNELISGMVEGSAITQGLLADVDEWFQEVRIMALDKRMDEEFEKFVKSADITKTDVMKSLKEFGDASQKMVKLGKRVLKEAGNIIKENETEAKKMKLKAKEKITIYDEHELMVDAAKWDRAVKMIINTFEDALKSTRNAAYKSTYTKAQKQFRYLASAMSKKILDLNAKQREVNDLKKESKESHGFNDMN
ncbi:unnamed protein product [Mytilus coruscus]|uniref:Uncharacterized protein n=1 Tax=Mytilus coruscus TaxID=42192 RepID=A0A6J8EV17_MYTCO|nr:unnamed protein product [Mytilus coruscus]